MYYIASNGIKTAVIFPDPDPMCPRDPDYQENLTKMVCWHSRLKLGDKHDYKSPNSFAEDMADEYLSQKNVIQALINGEFADFRLGDEKKDGSFCVEGKVGLIPGKETWEVMDWSVNKETLEVIEGEAIFDVDMDILDYCWPDEIMRACNKYGDVAIMPLFLYNHSELSISTSSFVGRAHHADWDSSQVGYIYLDKKTTMENTALDGDQITLAMHLPYAESITVPRDPAEDLKTTMEKAGYAPVRAKDIKNIEKSRSDDPGDTILDPKWVRDQLLFKKDRTLYVFENYNPDNTLRICPVASFNPDLKPMTEEAWRSRAEEAMKADVKEYDNFLAGEVYGYELYEGMECTESCVGFNPGSEDIKNLMNDELCGWFEGKLDFESDYSDAFDIQEFFDTHHFDGLMQDITKKVATVLYEDFQSKDPFPYGMSFQDIRSNKDYVLDWITSELYEEHKMPTVNEIRKSIFEHAGVARALQPKISIADLEPGREYTQEELKQIFQKKPTLEEMVAAASAKKTSSDNSAKQQNQDIAR